MPMYGGDPPAAEHAMMQNMQWDEHLHRPKTVSHTRHPGEQANYIFTDSHARSAHFDQTWQQTPSQLPARNWFNPLQK